VALQTLYKVARRRSVAFVISDFFTSGYERALSLASARHDIVPVMIADPRDEEMSDVGLANFQDLESGEDILVDTSDPRVRAYYKHKMKAQRAQQMVGQQILQAHAQVSAAEDYIVARRGAIGAEARTRLAEAGAALVQAQQLQSANPEQALQYAQRANQLAGQAIQYAQNDVSAFQGPGSSGMLGGGGNSGGGGMLGAVLGGIVINSLLGGGGGSGRGGSSGGLGGMLGGGGGGRMSPGSFGGGGTRGRRGGGRF